MKFFISGSGPASNQETREFVDQVPIYPKGEHNADGTDSGNGSEDEEQHWEDVHNQSVSEDNFSDKKPQSILKAQPQVFIERDALPKKKRKKKVSKKESLRNRKTVVFHFPEGMNVPERIATEEEKQVFMVKARKTFLVLRRKLTGRKETVPWRMSVHCSPSLLQQRTKKLTKDDFLQLPQETFVREIDLSDEEAETGGNNDDGHSYRTISESSADFEIEIVTETQSKPVDDDEVFPSTSQSCNQNAGEQELTLCDDEDEDLRKPSRRQEMRMIMRAIHLQNQMQEQLEREGKSRVRRRPTFKTKGRRNTIPMASRNTKPPPPSSQDEKENASQEEPKKLVKLSRKLSKDGGSRPRKISRDNSGAAAAPPPSTPRDSIDSLEPKQKNRLRPFKYINTKLAFKQLVQHLSGSESESGSASSSRHNSISLSEQDNMSAILDGDIIRPRSVSLQLPGKVVHTRYRKVSREEASPYYKETSQSTQSIN